VRDFFFRDQQKGSSIRIQDVIIRGFIGNKNRIWCHFHYQLVKEITRENIIRIVYQNSDRKSVPVQRTKNPDASGASPRHYDAPVARALDKQGSGIPVIEMNRMRPPQGGRAGARGGGQGVQYNKKLIADM
jgi:hypothetical protein